MKRICVLFSMLIFTGNFCFSQRDIFGVYENSMWQLELNNDSTYKFIQDDSVETGKFKMRGDAIITTSSKDSISKELFCFYYINDDILIPKVKLGLVMALKKDSLFDNYYIMYERFMNPYFKTAKYYDSGQLNYEVERMESFIVIFHYFENGNISAIKTFEHGYKTGNWYYFDMNGNLVKIEEYKKDKLKTVVTRLDENNF